MSVLLRYLLVAVVALIATGILITQVKVPQNEKNDIVDRISACIRQKMYPFESLNPSRIPADGDMYTHTRHITKAGDDVFTWVNLASDVTAPEHHEQLLDTDSVLILTILKDETSWGKNRTFLHYFALIQSFDYPVNRLSLGLLVSDNSTMLSIKQQLNDYFSKNLKRASPNPAFNRITLIHVHNDLKLSREGRKDQAVQKQRRRHLASLRNQLLYTSLRNEDSVLWIDADIESISTNALTKMVKSGKDIIVTHTVRADGSVYDLNTWKGSRTKPNEEERRGMDEGKEFVPRHAEGIQFTDAFSTGLQEYVEIDSVGGTVLFVKGEVHRSGVTFTNVYVVGAEWEHEGYDGIESEGLCFVAKLNGFKCWAAAKLKAVHTGNE